MLRIMRDRLSYGTTTSWSIRERPPNAVARRLAWHRGMGDRAVALDDQIAILVREDGLKDSHLDEAGQNAEAARAVDLAAGGREKRVRAVLVNERREQPEVAARKAARQAGRHIDLAPRLILRPVEAAGVVP